MAIRNRVGTAFAVVGVLAVLAGSMVLVSAAPAGASTATITVTSNADAPGICPSVDSCTFAQALTDANVNGPNENDDVTIVFAPGLGTISLTDTLNYSGGSGGSHALTVDGNGAIITSANSIQLFSSSTSGMVTITGTTWTNGRSTTSGGAVETVGPLTVTDSVFSDNAADLAGGAVYAFGGLEMHRVTFDNNNALNQAGGFVSGSYATITDAKFTSNTTTDGDGGAGAVYGVSSLSGITAMGNAAPSGGGAFYFQDDTSITDSSFLSNSTSLGGGAIRCEIGGCLVSVSNSLFVGNVAEGSGGAITGDLVSVEGSQFFGNQTSGIGGAIYSDHAESNSSTFVGNSADAYAGAVFGYVGFDVSASSFTSNTADIYGGALMAVTGESSLVNSTVAGNTVGTGGIILVNGELAVEASTIVGNAITNEVEAFVLSVSELSLFATVLTSDDTADRLCLTASTSMGYNFANDDTCGLTAAGDSQDSSNDPLLSSLDTHRSFGFTMIPLVGSPLIGAIPNDACFAGLVGDLTTDQRGFARPNVVGGLCDIGAVQLTPEVTVEVSSSGDLQVSVSEFASMVTITMYSTPTVLGTISVNELGEGSASFAIPCGIEGGTHTIVATAGGGQTALTQMTVNECLLPVFAG